jgi:hypothetical protein
MSRTGQMGRRLFPFSVTKTHDERRAIEPLTSSLYGRGCKNGKDVTQSCARHHAQTYGYFGVKLMG